MLTFKQLEAIYWVVELGGFTQAAARLHTTQSAVSKRIQELEVLFETPLFDRTQRTARLSDKGREMYEIAKNLLAQRNTAVETFARPDVIERRLRVGVTEVAAMTWLPAFVAAVQAAYPRVRIEAEADAMVPLREKLLANDLDLAVVPVEIEEPRFATELVGEVEMAWMCKPGLVGRKTMQLGSLAAHTFLVEGARSGTGRMFHRWLKSQPFEPASTIVCSNLVAVVAMTVSGLGISRLPRHCMRPLVDAGLLQEFKVTPQAPDVPYVAAFKKELRSSFTDSIVGLVKASCDFRRVFQVAAPARSRAGR
jgi:DNA-binding transcriptional LysR family regulator